MSTLELLDYRRRVAEMYRRVRIATDPHRAWEGWVADRQALFESHPQSAWPPSERHRRTLRYFPYDPRWRLEVDVEPVGEQTRELEHSSAGTTSFSRVGHVDLGQTGRLMLYWLSGYAGGVFLPFRDLTNGTSTYGGGRYLLDTAKGADLGGGDGRLILDFNFAYHPSCVHSDQWSCPLPPPDNRLPVEVQAGERLP